MGKASSAKKVARAARAGGRSKAGQPRNLLFPSVLTVVMVLGLSLVFYARGSRQSSASDGPPQLGEHIHLAYGIYICDTYLPNLPEFENAEGIHTHGDGVIHAHPFSALATGRNATLGLFMKSAGVTLSDTKLVVDGKTHKNGDKCGKDTGTLQVLKWDNNADTTPTRITGKLSSVRLDKDGASIAVVFAPLGADVPTPPSHDNLAALGAVDSGAAPPTTESTGSTSSTASTATTATTAASGATTTSKP
jgi:hypothetical protein